MCVKCDSDLATAEKVQAEQIEEWIGKWGGIRIIRIFYY